MKAGAAPARADAEACLFAVKCLIASLLALYFAFRLGLTRPFWAIGTVYIVSQPLSGASMSRGVFRLLGTFVGGIATVALVPTFANEPMVLSIALAVWIGFCLYLALLDRTPRSYAFLLAGYTASLIGYPAVTAPADVFAIAATRLQEIMIGVACASLVHALILPRTVSGRVQARVRTLVKDTERWTLDMLGEARPVVLAADRARAAAALLELHQMAVHLPFDAAAGSAKKEVLRALHDRLSSLIIHSSGLEEALMERHRAKVALTPQLAASMEKVHALLSAPAGPHSAAQAAALRVELTSEPSAVGGTGWESLDEQIVRADLAELISAHGDCRVLESRLRDARAGWNRTLPEPPWRVRGHVLHRDHWLAARSASGLVVGLTLACLLWIQTGWTHGATAVSVMGALCALAGMGEAPEASVWRYLIGSVLGVAVGLFYGVVVLPRTTDFLVLAAVLAPALMLFGCLLARPATAFVALAVLLCFPIIAGLGTTNATNVLSSINDSVALVVGVAMTLASVALFQTIGVRHSRGRLLRAIAGDAAKLCSGRIRDLDACRSRMLDRVGMLAARLAGHPDGHHLLRVALADVRSAEAAALLRDMGRRCADPEAVRRLDTLLGALSANYRRRRDTGEASETVLLDALDKARRAVAAYSCMPAASTLPVLARLRRDVCARSLGGKE